MPTRNKMVIRNKQSKKTRSNSKSTSNNSSIEIFQFALDKKGL